MGTGIAQLAAVKGMDVVITDSSQQALDRSMTSTERSLNRLVAKEKLSQAQADAAIKRIHVTADLQVLVAWIPGRHAPMCKPYDRTHMQAICCCRHSGTLTLWWKQSTRTRR